MFHDTPNDTHRLSAFIHFSLFPFSFFKVTKTAWTEFWQYPAETLIIGIGDCEDTSILLGAILENLKYEYYIAIGKVYHDGELLGYHAWVQANIDKPVLIETTLDKVPSSWIAIDNIGQVFTNVGMIEYEAMLLFNKKETIIINEEIFEPMKKGLRSTTKRSKVDKIRKEWR